MIHKHVSHDSLERFAFLWSEMRLIIAALALFIGGVPPAFFFLPFLGLFDLVGILLKAAWIISGVASLYLVYRWLGAGQKLFGHNDMKDKVAFLVMSVSGINLGIVGLIGINVGMTISAAYALFLIVGVLYLVSAFHLYRRWVKARYDVFK